MRADLAYYCHLARLERQTGVHGPRLVRQPQLNDNPPPPM
jgi:hypothetical protein